MLPKITLILLLIKTIYSEDYTNVDKFWNASTFSSENRATECIKSVLKKNFPCGTLITLVEDTNDGKLLKLLNDENSCYSYILRSYSEQDCNIPTPMYVIRAENINEFKDGFMTVTNDFYFNARGRFIIELKSLEDNDANSVFRILMAHRVFDSILIRKTNNNEVMIDTYYPFKGSNCAKILEVATIGNCKDVDSLTWVKTEEISFKNCTVKVAAKPDIPNFIFNRSDYIENGKPMSGTEQLFLEIMAKKEGMKLDYTFMTQKQTYGVVLPNHTATGVLSFLQNRDVDIAAGGFVLMRNRVLLFDYVWGFNYAAFKVFTPAAGEEVWRDVYREFSGQTWIFILTSYCLVAVISMVTRNLLLKRSRNKYPMGLLLWGYFYLNTCSRLSKEKRFRVIMTSWVWFTFFIINFYNTALYALLTGREQIKRQISAERLYELPFQPCISETTRIFFWFSYKKKLPISKDIPECKYTATALDYVASHKSTYALELDYVYTLNEYKYIDDEGNSKLDTWSFSLDNNIAMFLVRGFPLRDKFQVTALRMHESGIMKQQLEKISYQKNAHVLKRKHVTHFQKILISDLRIHFGVLFVGSVLSTVCFILEFCWYRYSK